MTGVTDTGFVRATLPEVLAGIETANIATFGSGIIQTAQSPLGQINGLFADLATSFWEVAEAVYGSLDPDQAEGARLDMLGRIRGVTRAGDEADDSFRRRITNAGRADIYIRDLIAALEETDGVTCTRVHVNDSDGPAANGIPGHSLAIAVTGGTDEAVAAVIHAHTVPGIGLHGNTSVGIDDAGLCRTITFLRPMAVRIQLQVTVAATPTLCACRAATRAEIQAALVSALSCASDCGLGNGMDVTANRIISGLASVSGAEVLSVIGARGDAEILGALPIDIAFAEVASLASSDISVVYA